MISLREAAFGALLLAVCCIGLSRALWTPDEPREAEISREMYLSPSIVPSLDDELFIEKPPLYYWTVAGVFALVGQPSVAAARAVSAAASFLTLLLVFAWGRRDFSMGVGAAAALGLATSTQFMISSHWVLIDPLLMLFTTAALYASSRIVEGGTGYRPLTVFYVALVLAVWTKGLIGPVLVGVGLVAYSVVCRSAAPVRRLRPVVGVAVLAAATGLFAALVGAESGFGAVREWFWVNHVLRFIDPTTTGHDQPLYYYLTAIPIAVFPWWVPFAAALRPRIWRGPLESRGDELQRRKLFLGAVSIGMTVLLSASATKRGIYLLPMLPPLFLLLAVLASEWWAAQPERVRAHAWTIQLTLLAVCAAVPPAVALGYFHSVRFGPVVFIIAVAAFATVAVIYARRGDRPKALVLLAATALSSVVGLIGVAAPLAAPLKNLRPFIAAIGDEIPAGQPIYVFGDFDETIRGIVPFVTGHAVVPAGAAELTALHPRYVLVQTKNGDPAPLLDPSYRLQRSRTFGQDRYLALWERDLPGTVAGEHPARGPAAATSPP